MTKLTFFSVLKSNLKCAFCKNVNCPIRYMPHREKTYIYNASRCVTKCEKDRKSLKNEVSKK